MQYCDLKAHRLSLRKLRQIIAIKTINTVYIHSIINHPFALFALFELFELFEPRTNLLLIQKPPEGGFCFELPMKKIGLPSLMQEQLIHALDKTRWIIELTALC